MFQDVVLQASIAEALWVTVIDLLNWEYTRLC